MPDLMDQMYSSQQINIPPNLPFILKQYAKAAIRTQPYDLLLWSAAYFRAKVNNTPPPVKERLEYPPVDTPSRLSPGFLKVLHKQLRHREFVCSDELYEKWLGVCLVKEALDTMLEIGNMKGQVHWLKFVAVAAGNLCPTLSKTMVMICNILTEEPEGGSAMIPVEIFVSLYQFLAALDCGPEPPKSISLPPNYVQQLEIDSKPSDTSNNLQTDEGLHKKAVVFETDSHAGLMTWDDLKPDEVSDKVRSPKASSEQRADLEAGLEVLDEAKASKVVTLYASQPQQEESNYSMHLTTATHPPQSPPISTISSKTEACVSHSSLKENDDWMKLEKTKSNHDDLKKEDVKSDEAEENIPSTENISGQLSATLKVSSGTVNEENELITETKVEDNFKAAEDEIISEGNIVNDLPEKQDVVPITEGSIENISETIITTEEFEMNETIYEREVVDESTKEPNVVLLTESSKEDGSEKINGDNNDQHVEFESKADVVKTEGIQSEDSIFPVDESVTVQNFVDVQDGSIVSYSTAEIRKGVLGDNSNDKIERASSENTVKAAETVHNIELTLESSSKLLANEQPSSETNEEIFSQSFSDSPTKRSQSFIVLPPEKKWIHVPGIGPVIPKAQVLAVVEYMQHWASKQEGMVMPRNINHLLCPPLDLPESDIGV